MQVVVQLQFIGGGGLVTLDVKSYVFLEAFL